MSVYCNSLTAEVTWLVGAKGHHKESHHAKGRFIGNRGKRQPLSKSGRKRERGVGRAWF